MRPLHDADNMRRRIEEIKEVPALPDAGRKLLALQDDPQAGARELAEIIELDPLLSSQIIRTASTPFFRAVSKPQTVQDAILTLGYTRALNLALGLCAGRVFKLPMSGPIGLKACWQHAVYCATLCQLLCEAMPAAKQLNAGTAYLAGLLHNIGIMFFGYSFPGEFKNLNKALTDQAEQGLVEVEEKQLGSNHMEIGVWLLRKWAMPGAIMTAVFEHHNSQYKGKYREYANLVLIANRSLKGHGIGDETSDELPLDVLDHLGLTSEHVFLASTRLMASHEELDSLVQSLIASEA